MSIEIMNQEQLTCATNYVRKSDIIKWLIRNGVPYFTAKDGTVFTTTKAIDEALSNKTKHGIEFK